MKTKINYIVWQCQCCNKTIIGEHGSDHCTKNCNCGAMCWEDIGCVVLKEGKKLTS